MSYVSVKIDPLNNGNFSEVTNDIVDIRNLSIYTDESDFFGGIFRRSSLIFSLNNNTRKYSTRNNSNSFFSTSTRDNALVEFEWHSNNPNLDSFFLFRGVLSEGSTSNNLTKRTIELEAVDQLKYVDEITLEDADFQSLTGNLNEDFIKSFLRIVFAKNTPNLNETFNVFDTNDDTENISLSIESIFPPSDSFYNSTGTSALELLNELIASTNSYSVFENNRQNSIFYIRSRPTLNQNIKLTIDNRDIVSIGNQVDGWNKIFNKLVINSDESTSFQDDTSISLYGERILDIQTYSAPSQTLADSYFDYFASPKQELDLFLRFNHRNLDINNGDRIAVNLEDINNNFSIHPLSSDNFFVIRKELDFTTDVLKLRLREL